MSCEENLVEHAKLITTGNPLGKANCNINADLFRLFLLKMQDELRILPEKR